MKRKDYISPKSNIVEMRVNYLMAASDSADKAPVKPGDGDGQFEGAAKVSTSLFDDGWSE